MLICKRITQLWAVAVAALLLVVACEDKARIRTQEDKLAYSIGYSMGKNISSSLEERGDKPDVDLLVSGIRAAIQGSSDVLTDEEARQAVLKTNRLCQLIPVSDPDKLVAEPTSNDTVRVMAMIRQGSLQWQTQRDFPYPILPVLKEMDSGGT